MHQCIEILPKLFIRRFFFSIKKDLKQSHVIDANITIYKIRILCLKISRSSRKKQVFNEKESKIEKNIDETY